MADRLDRAARRVFGSPGKPEVRLREAVRVDNPFLAGPLIERLGPAGDDRVRVKVRRPEDHLVFDLLLDNLRIGSADDGTAQLVRADGDRRGVLIVELPPQAFGERAYLDLKSKIDATEANELPPTRDGKPVIRGKTAEKQMAALPDPPEPLALPARVRMAGRSRLAFRMPDGEAALPFSLAAVLGAMADWPMNLDLGACADRFLDPLWLTERLAAGLNAAIAGAVAGEEAPAVQRAIVEGAERVAAFAAGGIGAGATAPAAWEALRAEAAEIVARHPRLRDGDLGAATLGALAAGVAGRLAGIAGLRGARSRRGTGRRCRS